ncbi:synaptonemal complex central element protein 1-like [Thomomys bottae]
MAGKPEPSEEKKRESTTEEEEAAAAATKRGHLESSPVCGPGVVIGASRKTEYREEPQKRTPVPPAEWQAKSSKMTEDLLTMVKKLQKEGSLEPQIKDLINRINELQQAKQTSNKELGESQAHREFLHGQLDSLNGEEEHLEEVLKKKQEALKILQEHWHKKKSKAQWLDGREQLEDLTGQHKDLWELQMLEQRLTQEIRALERSQENLQAESEAGAGRGLGRGLGRGQAPGEPGVGWPQDWGRGQPWCGRGPADAPPPQGTCCGFGFRRWSARLGAFRAPLRATAGCRRDPGVSRGELGGVADRTPTGSGRASPSLTPLPAGRPPAPPPRGAPGAAGGAGPDSRASSTRPPSARPRPPPARPARKE